MRGGGEGRPEGGCRLEAAPRACLSPPWSAGAGHPDEAQKARRTLVGQRRPAEGRWMRAGGLQGAPERPQNAPERLEDARKTPAEACPGAESGLPESGASSSASSASAPREAALVPASTPWSIPAGCWNAPQGHGRGLSTPGCMPSGRPANWASWFLILIFVNKNAELFLTETRFFMGFRASVLRHLSYV